MPRKAPTMKSIIVDKISSVTQACGLSHELRISTDIPCEEGVVLNINADTVAAAIGAALSAEKLILCTGAPGILERRDDPRSLVSFTDLAGLKRLEKSGTLEGGMLPRCSRTRARAR
jgi:acetylglutamate kinase